MLCILAHRISLCYTVLMFNEELFNIQEFQNALILWYGDYGRDLPWRHTHDPYAIWVSEIMLQQTQVETVKGYYTRFLDTLPDIHALADASQDTAYKLWEGLGYYSRIRNMQTAAQTIMSDYNGIFPSDYQQILKLKGIGPYTAAAISSIAFGNEKGVIDGNTLRIISRLFDLSDNIAKDQTKKAFGQIMDTLIKGADPSAFNQAMMDLGATVCTPRKPSCSTCPVRNFCQAYASKRSSVLPVNIKNVKHDEQIYVTAILYAGERIYLYKNTEGLLQNLYALPQYEAESPFEFERLFEDEFHTAVRLNTYIKEVKHVFTHKTWHMHVYTGMIEDADKLPEQLQSHLYSIDEIRDLAISTAHRKVLALI